MDITSNRRNEHGKYLNLSLARSHAARVSHIRKRKKVTQGQQQPPSAEHQYLIPFQIPKHSIRPFKGSSDPFASFGQPLTPELTNVLAFVKNIALPSIYMNTFWQRLCGGTGPNSPPLPTPRTELISYHAANRDWQNTLLGLQDECSSLACLSAYASMIAKISPASWARSSSLSMRSRAIFLFRQSLQGHIHEDEALSRYTLVLYGLFTSECIDENVQAARAHVNLLRQIFESGKFDIQLVIQTLYDDVDLAMKYSHRTFFDVDHWCADTIAPFFAEVARMLPLPNVEEHNVHASITYLPLRELWVRNQVTIETITHGRRWHIQWTELGLQEMAFGYFAVSGLLGSGQLNNMYVDISENKVMTELSDGERYAQAALVIGMLYTMRRVRGECYMGGVDLRDCSGALMRQLRKSFRLAIDRSTPAELNRFAEAHLWVTYVGALEEIGRESHAQKATFVDMWFKERLRLQAMRLEVRCWQRMKEIAQVFLYASFVEPCGETWFEDVLGMKPVDIP